MEDIITRIVIIGEKPVTSKQKIFLKNIAGRDVNTLENLDNIQNLVKQNILLIINLSVNGAEQLENLSAIDEKRASIIGIGDKKNANLLSLAITANIAAFIDDDHEEQEIINTVNDIIYKRSKSKNINTFNIFINAKGGAGASFIASNMAYILSQTLNAKVALIDMDLQFGSLGLNFNINMPKYTIMDALMEIEGLDEVSLSGYMEKYSETLGLLLPSNHDVIIPGEVNPQSLEKLLTLLRKNYNHLIIDLPRMIDPLSTMIMEQSDNIVIVLQQNLAQFRDGRHLINILNKDLEIPLDRIVIIINRFDKNNSLKKEDLVKLVNHNKVYTVTNDYELVATTTNLGIPLFEHSGKSKIAKDLKKLAYTLGKIEQFKKPGLFNRFIDMF